jgi:catechol 2,3-dioxygenase
MNVFLNVTPIRFLRLNRPPAQWTVEGRELITGILPLRFQNLMPVTPWRRQPNPGFGPARRSEPPRGQVHFYVGDLLQAKSFYHHALGLALMTWRYLGALFTSDAGYHYHVGLNTWAAGSPPASPDDAGFSSGNWSCPPRRM